MKLVTYLQNGNEQLACYYDGYLYDMDTLHPDLPNSMGMMLHYWEDLFEVAQQGHEALVDGRIGQDRGISIEDAQLLAPLPFPPRLLLLAIVPHN